MSDTQNSENSTTSSALETILNDQRLRYVDWLEPVVVASSATLGETVAAMRAAHMGCALIGDNDTLTGIFTERDYLDKVAGEHLPASTPITELMTADPIALTPEDSLGDLIRTIVKGGYRHLPVVDAEKRILGMIDAITVVRYIAEHFPTEVLNVPAVPPGGLSTAEGA